jgi:hypothetical protein
MSFRVQREFSMSLRHSSFHAAILFSLLGVSSLHGQTQANTLTWHNNTERTGINASEYELTPANVNAKRFGKIGFFPTNGTVDAEPLYVAQLTINGSPRNVVFIVDEHNTVYADDAKAGAVLWSTSLTPSGETTSDNHGCTQVTPEIGITSTPVIDPAEGPHGAIYVVSMTKDGSGNYYQRINALDLTTGKQLFGGPKVISAKFPGTGDGSSSGNVLFSPGQYEERVGLLEWHGAIYTAWTSHCDRRPYTGWIIGYDASTLAQTAVVNITPNGNSGGIWMGGAGIAAGQTKMYVLDGNGTFDTTLNGSGFPSQGDFGNAALALTSNGKNGLYISDYYATDTTVQQSNADVDFGSGGIVLFSATDDAGNYHQLGVAAGKDHNVYLLDTANMGHYHPNGGHVYQVLSGALPNGEWAAPAYFDNKIYYGGVQDNVKAFSISNARLVNTPASMTTNTFGYPGTTPSISSNGPTNGIVWAINQASPAVLYAYNAEDLSQELYDSTQSGTRDSIGNVDHFVTPLIANGRVYIPTQTGVAVFGLLGD